MLHGFSNVAGSALEIVCRIRRVHCLKRRFVVQIEKCSATADARLRLTPARTGDRSCRKQAGPHTSRYHGDEPPWLAPSRRFAQTDGDHTTAIPALTLHRRQAPTEPLHCIYNLGLGVVAQGDKQVLLGGEAIGYGPGQSMLTTIDLPVVSHVTRATAREPFLGMMLTLDARSVLQTRFRDG